MYLASGGNNLGNWIKKGIEIEKVSIKDCEAKSLKEYENDY